MYEYLDTMNEQALAGSLTPIITAIIAVGHLWNKSTASGILEHDYGQIQAHVCLDCVLVWNCPLGCFKRHEHTQLQTEVGWVVQLPDTKLQTSRYKATNWSWAWFNFQIQSYKLNSPLRKQHPKKKSNRSKSHTPTPPLCLLLRSFSSQNLYVLHKAVCNKKETVF